MLGADAERVTVVVDRPSSPARAAALERARRAGRSRWTFAALVVAALALRLFFAVGPHSSPDSDEAVVGLMAVRLLHGEIPGAFYWHQHYGGSLESFAVAPFVALFGTTTLGLRAATVVVSLAVSWFTWRVARHLFRPVIAAWVGVVSLFFPLAAIRFSTFERDFYVPTAALGLAAVLVALNLDERPGERRYWMGLGLVTGIGWWTSPNVVYFAAPLVAWLAVRGHWRQVRNATAGAGAFLLGSCVWIVASLRVGLSDVVRAPPVGGSSTFVSRFGFFWSHGLPFALGLRAPLKGHWYVVAAAGIAIYVAVLVAFAFALRGTRLRDAPDVFLLASSPFVFAAFIGNWTLLEGRYVYFLACLMPFLIGRLLQLRAGRIVAGVLLVVATVGFATQYGNLVKNDPGSTEPLARAIAARGFHTAVGSYWVTYKMTYESNELVIGSPVKGMVGRRHAPYEEKVVDSRPAYVFGYYCQRPDYARIVHALEQDRIHFEIVARGSYCAVLPAVRYLPGLPRPAGARSARRRSFDSPLPVARHSLRPG